MGVWMSRMGARFPPVAAWAYRFPVWAAHFPPVAAKYKKIYNILVTAWAYAFPVWAAHMPTSGWLDVSISRMGR